MGVEGGGTRRLEIQFLPLSRTLQVCLFSSTGLLENRTLSSVQKGDSHIENQSVDDNIPVQCTKYI